MARGPDLLGVRLANELEIPIKEFPANWDKFPKTAGMIRNGEMSEYGNALLAMWDGQSSGTLNMVSNMERKGKRVITVVCK